MKSSRALVAAVLLALLFGAAEASAQATQPSGRRVISWTADVVSVGEGDLVTILIDEYTVASADRDESATQERGRNAGVSLTPGFRGGIQSRNDVRSRTEGGSARRERFAAEITTRVVEMLPDGTARIEGTKKVQIDDHEQTVTVRGVVRPQDISAANTIESWRVADAELLYESNGELGRTGGIWSKLLDIILP